MVQRQAFERVFVALDTPDEENALALCDKLAGVVGGVKVGNELFTAIGPAGVGRITATGMAVFLDLKFHDIPNTVGRAVGSARALQPYMLTVHAAGGETMMRAAAEAAAGPERPLVIAVTVLTSMTGDELAATGIAVPLDNHALHLAGLARACGLDGVTCAAHEAPMLRQACGPDFALVVPGIRPAVVAGDDQKRTVTPSEAVRRGADFLVVGRPITGADDPAGVARAVVDEIAEAAP